MICATISCVVVPLVASNIRVTESGEMFSGCEYADCENIRFATVWSKMCHRLHVIYCKRQ